jgi:nucleoid DNA-binding protein
MKTKLLLLAAVLITSITFSQTSKKGYDFYMATSDFPQSQKMNKGELIDAMAKDASLSKADAGKALNPLISKSATRTGRNPQTGKSIQIHNGKTSEAGLSKADAKKSYKNRKKSTNRFNY